MIKTSDTYTSPLEEAYRATRTPTLKYSGTLDSLLSDIEESPQNPVVKAFHPARIIRAAVDTTIEKPELGVSLVRKSIDSAVAMYRSPHEAPRKARELRKTWQDEDFLEARVRQADDVTTSLASNPLFSEISALEIQKRHKGKPILFIALAHGGIAAGLDVFCTYQSAEPSTFYVARLSTQKLGDKKPHLNACEIEYLKKSAIGKAVVIFDEDRASGRSLDIAEKYFSELFGCSVDVITNLDMRDAIKKLRNETISSTDHNLITTMFADTFASDTPESYEHFEHLVKLYTLKKSVPNNKPINSSLIISSPPSAHTLNFTKKINEHNSLTTIIEKQADKYSKISDFTKKKSYF